MSLLVVGLLLLIGIVLCRNQVANLLTKCFATVRVDGEWETHIDKGTGYEKHERATLHQLCNYVWGHTETVAGETKTYLLKGRLTGERLSLLYRQSDGAGFDCGAILLSVRSSEKHMAGYEVGIESDTDAVKTFKYRWNRNP